MKKTIFLLDDVLNTGSTLMFAANFLIQFPIKGLRTVILVNRKHRLFPIRADFVGLSLATTLKEHISVDFSDKNNGVYLS
jgi:pyrimidine operon attenuation protein/uracil phosphoribosyltransferase